MPRRLRNKEFYAVIRGFSLDIPTIFSSWGDAHPLVTGHNIWKYKAFETLGEAEAYMEENRVTHFDYEIKPGAGETTPLKGQMAYYAVANGRNPGIEEYYCGKGGAEPKVVNFSGSCHKHFRTMQQAEAFIADWEEMYACMVKTWIRKELSKGRRPIRMGLVHLSSIWEDHDGTSTVNELTQSFDAITL